MKLSFVIPAYNEEKFIGKCLDSIFKEIASKVYDIEIIVVNNASTDRTKEVAQSFAGVKVVDEPHKGLSRARQSGFLASSGDLIANVDADTLLPTGWVEKVFNEFSRDPKLVALSGPFIYYDLSKGIKFWVRLFYFVGYLGYVFNHYILHVSAIVQGGNFILKRSALEQIGGFNVKFDFYGEDTDIAHRISKVGKVKFTFKLPMYTSGRRLRGEGVVTMAWRYLMNHLWTLIFRKPVTKNFIDVRK